MYVEVDEWNADLNTFYEQHRNTYADQMERVPQLADDALDENLLPNDDEAVEGIEPGPPMRESFLPEHAIRKNNKSMAPKIHPSKTFTQVAQEKT